MKKSKYLCSICIFLVGCASFTTTQTDKSYEDEEGNPIREITTRANAITFFASKSALANWKASQTDKTQGASVGSLSQENNSPEALGTILGAALKEASKIK